MSSDSPDNEYYTERMGIRAVINKHMDTFAEKGSAGHIMGMGDTIATLHSFIAGIRDSDKDWPEAWAEAGGPAFLESVMDNDLRGMDKRACHSAMEAIVRLLERKGLLLVVEAANPVYGELSALEDELRELSRDPMLVEAGGYDDDDDWGDEDLLDLEDELLV